MAWLLSPRCRPIGGAPFRRFWRLALPLLAAPLAGCGGELDSPGEALRIFSSTLDPAFIGEDYTYDIVVTGGLAPYRFELQGGSLPPGVSLQNGSLSGAPTREGRFDFTVSVSDARLSRTVQDFSLEVTTPPPAELILNVPPTPISDTVTVPIRVEGGRSLQALRTQIRWNASLFEFVPGSVRAARGDLAVLQRAQGGQLSVDVAFLGPALTGDAQLFTFDLRPVEPNSLSLSARTEYRTRGGEHGFSSTEDGTETPTGDTGEGETGTGTDDGNGAGDDQNGEPDGDNDPDGDSDPEGGI